MEEIWNAQFETAEIEEKEPSPYVLFVQQQVAELVAQRVSTVEAIRAAVVALGEANIDDIDEICEAAGYPLNHWFDDKGQPRDA